MCSQIYFHDGRHTYRGDVFLTADGFLGRRGGRQRLPGAALLLQITFLEIWGSINRARLFLDTSF